MRKLLKPEDVQGTTAYDNILRAWLGHKIEMLPEDESKILERWQDVDRLYRRGEINQMPDEPGKTYTKRFTWRGIVEWLTERHKISIRQAYEDIANAKRFFLFADGRTDVEYARGAAIEQGRMMQWAAFDAGKFEAAAMFFKECNNIEGLHDASPELPIYAEFQPPKITVVAKASELGFEPIDNIDEVVKQILDERKGAALSNDFDEAEVVDE